MAAETQVAKLGTSLPVPWVQDLAKDKLGVVPEKYVRTEQDPLIIPDSASLPQVPVIDLQKLTSGDSVDSELQRLHHACKEWGFFQAFVVSEQQKLEWADAFYMMTLPTYMRKPYLFPKLPQPF
ncbi:hypothetical protein CRG98_010551, partial [Punica granatum]